MSFFRTPTTGKPDYTGLQLQTSVSTLPIPIVYGQTKMAANVVWYNNFQTHTPNQSGKGGLFAGPGAQTTTYTADLIMALCEGPIAGIGTVWRDQSLFTLPQMGLTLFTGTTPQSVWGYLASADPAEALAYQGTAYLCAASYNLGDAASIGNHNFEVIGVLAGTGVNGIDADPAQVIYDFLTNTQYGAGFNSASIDTTTLYGSGGDASLQSYCRAAGIAFSPQLVSPEQGSSILARWLTILNCAAVWSGGKLKFIPYGDTVIASGTTLLATAPMTVPSPPSGFATVEVCGASQFVADGGVTYAFTGAALSHTGTAPTGPGTYGINPAGTYLFWLSDEQKAVVIAFSYSTPVSYVPNLTPLYNLQDTDFVDLGEGKDPLDVQRVDPYTLPNITRINCLSRSNGYAQVPVEARDQSQIEIYGPRVDSSVQAQEITDDINIGRIVAQVVNQRKLYIRATYTFTLSWEYALLEPMDLVTITDSGLGLANAVVRVTSIEEDEHGMLKVEAEDLDTLVSTPVLYPTATAIGTTPNRGLEANAVNTPLIYEPPPALTNGVAQLWLGASGASADPNWGGAFVWLSLDNSTYSQIGSLSQPARQGVTTGALASASGWNPSETLGVNLTASGGVLTGTTATSAQGGATLALLESELIAYESASLVSANVYTLTALERGLYGTTGAAHASAVAFTRLDAAIFDYDLPASYIGKTIYLKFQSFNVFGGGLEPLSACTAYSHSVLGGGVAMPANIAGFGGALTLDGATYTLAAQWTADPNATGYTVQWSATNSGTDWATVYSGPSPSFSALGWGYLATLYLRVQGVNGPYVSPSWVEITLTQGAQTTVPVENAGLYVDFASLSPTFQAQINTIAANADDSTTTLRADTVQGLALAQSDAAEANSFLIATSSAALTAAVAVTAAEAAANAAAGLTLSISQTSSLLNAGLAGNLALIQSNAIAQATVNSSLAGEITVLQSTVDDDVTSLQGQITSLAATAGSSNSVVSTKADTISAALSQIADSQEVADFLALVASGNEFTTALQNTAIVGAAVQNSNIAVANLTTAIATSTQVLGAGIAGNVAGLSNEAIVRATADTALASSITTLSGTVSGNTAAITSEATTRASADTSLANSISTLSSTVTTNNTTVNASISSEATTRASADGALSTSIASVAATAAQGTASGNIQFDAIAGSGLVGAVYELQVQAYGGGGWTYAGFRVEALTSGLSQFVVEASQFIVENGTTKNVVFATNSDGTLQLQTVTKVATTIQSLTQTTGGVPLMQIDFAGGAIYFNA